jgi:hypothetical protein
LVTFLVSQSHLKVGDFFGSSNAEKLTKGLISMEGSE